MRTKKKSVRELALQDLADEFSSDEYCSTGDRFVVLPIDLMGNDVSELNHELGLHKINKHNKKRK